MERTTTSPNKNLVKTALILSSIDGQVQAALYMPILALTTSTFNDTATINFSFSVTSGTMLIMTLVAGHLARFIDKRSLILIGTVIFILGGFAGSFSPTAEFLVGTRIIEGIGAGLVYPMVPAITAQLFQGRERTQVMGLLNGGACIIAFFLNFGAGWVGAMFGWRVCLWIYAILTIAIFMQIKYIPKMGPEKAIQDAERNAVKNHLSYKIFLFALANCVFSCCGMIFNMTLAGFIMDSGIGDSTIAGTAGSIQTMVGFLVGLLFARIVARLGRFVPAFCLASLAVCYFGLAASTDAVGIFISIMFIGLCCGVLYPYLNECVARNTTHGTVTIGMSYVSMGMMVGNFLCGFFVNFLSGITGGVFTAMFQIVGWGAIICSAIFCIAAIVNTVRTQQGQNEYIS